MNPADQRANRSTEAAPEGAAPDRGINKGRALLIVNPFSGGGKCRLAGRICDELRDAPYHVELLLTEGPGHARSAVADLPSDVSLVIAAGGDGTIHEIVSGMRVDSPPLAIIPLGTANLLARQFCIPLGMRGACSMLGRGRFRRLDIGSAGRARFHSVAGAGFDAAVVHRYHAARDHGATQSDYIKHIFGAIVGYKFPPIAVELDGKMVADNARAVFIANTRSYGGPFIIAPDAKADDGYLDVCIVFSRKPAAYAVYMGASMIGIHRYLPGVRMLRARRIRCWSDGEVPVQLDGDPAGHLPLDISIQPGAIELLTPP